jgi:sugar phosphate isomerase/epimerase
MRWGISSWTYSWNIGVPGYPAPASPFAAMDLLTRAHELGAQVLQIADNLPLERLSPDELDALARQAADWNITLEAGTRGVNPRRMLPFLGIAKRLNARLVRTLLHDADGCPTLAQAETNLRALLPALREMDLTLAVENHDFFPSQDLRALIDRIGDPRVGVCLDPVNNLAQGESTRDVLETLGPRTLNFHCKDYTIRRKPSNLGFDVEGCPAGEGLLDVPRCLACLPGADGLSCILELWTPWQERIEATCAQEDDWARRSAAYLSSL